MFTMHQYCDKSCVFSVVIASYMYESVQFVVAMMFETLSMVSTAARLICRLWLQIELRVVTD